MFYKGQKGAVNSVAYWLKYNDYSLTFKTGNYFTTIISYYTFWPKKG